MTWNKSRSFIENVLQPDAESICDRAVEWVTANKEPSEVFDDDALRSWALDHGFVEESDDEAATG